MGGTLYSADRRIRISTGRTWLHSAAGGVPEEVWANAAKHFDENQLVALVSTIATINAFNRFNVIVQQPAGWYQPGQFA